MWTERQWRDRRIGRREIFWSWAIVALILLGLAAGSGFRALTTDPTARVAHRVAD